MRNFAPEFWNSKNSSNFSTPQSFIVYNEYFASLLTIHLISYITNIASTSLLYKTNTIIELISRKGMLNMIICSCCRILSRIGIT